MSDKSARIRKSAQCCVVSVSFPETIDGVLKMVAGNRRKARWATDLDALLDFEPNDRLFWTAPKWLTEGDIVFFYQTRRAAARTTKLLSQARMQFPRRRKLIELLERAARNAESYAGSVFAVASVSGASRRLEKTGAHYVGKIFAPLGRARVFENPLRQTVFARYARIGRSTVTPLGRREFNGIRRLLSEHNRLPDFLRDAIAGGDAFGRVNARNWVAVSCQPEAKFVHEAQLRANLLDFFLSRVKDKGTSLLEECECRRAAKRTGRADYFVKVHGRWVAVEAKLKLTVENGRFAQATKYIGINSFTPTKGAHRNRAFRAHDVPICLVFDGKGAYFVAANGEFIRCAADSPFLERERFDEHAAQEIRNALKVILER